MRACPFAGLYCYKAFGKNVRIIVMDNLLPRRIKYHHKFDLKGSTYNRFASQQEKEKAVPTLKDVDFLHLYADGIYLDNETYLQLMSLFKRDCLVLQSFKIMDYSLLLGTLIICLKVYDDKKCPYDAIQQRRALTGANIKHLHAWASGRDAWSCMWVADRYQFKLRRHG